MKRPLRTLDMSGATQAERVALTGRVLVYASSEGGATGIALYNLARESRALVTDREGPRWL